MRGVLDFFAQLNYFVWRWSQRCFLCTHDLKWSLGSLILGLYIAGSGEPNFIHTEFLDIKNEFPGTEEGLYFIGRKWEVIFGFPQQNR